MVLSASYPTREIDFEHITVRDGLSQNSVYCILQDHKGFLWFGTEDGLNKYDGYEFLEYRPHSKKSEGLSSNFVLSIVEDRDHMIWIGTMDGGLSRFDRRMEKFTRYQNVPGDPTSLSHNVVRALLVDSGNTLWIGTDQGLQRFNPGTGTFTGYPALYDLPLGVTQKAVRVLLEDHQSGRIWVGTEGGFSELDPATGEFSHYFHDPGNSNSLSNNFVRAICEDRDGYLWIGTRDGGLNYFDPETRTFTRYANRPGDPKSLSNNTIWSIFEDSKGVLWIGTESGLNIFNREDDSFIRYRRDPSNPHGLSQEKVLSIRESGGGILWFGTHLGGVNKYNRERERFAHYYHEPGNNNSLSNNVVWSILEDHAGMLWIGTNKGVNRWNRNRNIFSHFYHQPGNPRSLSHNTVYYIFEDGEKGLWLGTTKGLDRFRPKTGEFDHYRPPPRDSIAPQSPIVLRIAGDPAGYFWVGTDQGLFKFFPETGRFIPYRNDPGDLGSLSSDVISALCFDRFGTLWAGTIVGGVNVFNRERGTFTHYKNQADDPGSLSGNNVSLFFEDSAGLLWIGTTGRGLNRFDREKKIFLHYGVEDGLPNAGIFGMLEDESGLLWIATNGGLSRFDPHGNVFKNFGLKEGLQSVEFNGGAYCRSRTGEMYFGGINGFNSFFPSQIVDNPYPPGIVLTGLKIFNQDVAVGETLHGIDVLRQSITESDQIELSHRHVVFTLQYSALHYAAPDRNLYAYKMDGLDSGWNYVGNRRIATYAHLAPGDYTFRVKGANKDKVWNDEGLRLGITIVPPYYKTTWFYVLAVLGVVLLGLFTHFMRVRQLRRHERKLSRLVEERTRELEQINHIVKAINSEMNLERFLYSLLKETFRLEDVDQATVLVHDRERDVFFDFLHFGTAMGAVSSSEWVYLTLDQVEEKYIKGATEIFEDIFTKEEPGKRSRRKKKKRPGKTKTRMTIRIRVDNRTEGYLVFQRAQEVPANEEASIDLLKNLKDHIASAFIKDKLLFELEKAKQRAERKQKEAEDANRYKSDFLARMSHEIRTPMNSVIGFTELLLNTQLNEEQFDFTRTIRQSGEALLTIINDILDLSKIEAGRLTLEPMEFNPELMAFNICELLVPRIGTRPVEMLCTIDPHLPSSLTGDPGRFRQVLINLVGNAVKFTEEGEIELSLQVEETADRRLKLAARVRDTGIGIPKQKMDTIFEAFQQADISTTREYGGTGLGLSICKEIAHLMEGDITVASEPGAGSTFCFTAWMEKPGVHMEQATAVIPVNRVAGNKILVVDDNPRSLEILRTHLSALGTRVTALPRGENTVSVLRDALEQGDPFHLCILDIHMPGKSGYDIAKLIREQDGDPGRTIASIPLLALTTTSERRSRQFLESGFDGFLPKPVQRRRLLERIFRVAAKEEPLQGGAPSRRRKQAQPRPAAPAALPEIKTAAPGGDAAHIPAAKAPETNRPVQNGPKTKTPGAAAKETAAQGTTDKNIRILMAEDNEINQKLTRFALVKEGYQLDIANNGEEAVDMLTERPGDYDLILMDIQMPRMDGKEATRRIRGKGHDIPIIAMTASSMRGDREKCFDAGMNDYISKPIKIENVYRVIKKWVHGDPGEEENDGETGSK